MIQDDIDTINNAMYGADVRSAIANGIQAISDEETQHISDVQAITDSQNGQIANLNLSLQNIINNAGDSNIEIVDARNGYNTLKDKFDGIARDVRFFGAKGDGVTDDASSIQACINASNAGDIIIFSKGTYIVGTELIGKPGIWYRGVSFQQAIIQMKSNSNLEAVFKLPENTTTDYNYQFGMSDLQIDGNKANNTTGHGLLLYNLYTSVLQNVRIANCKQTGINMAYQSKATNTVHIQDCWVYANDGYGIFLDAHCGDMHIIGGDIGDNLLDNITINSPSTCIRNATIWGSRNGNGISITGTSSSDQIFDNQIEGNAQNGIYIFSASHVIIKGNKIYDNANLPQNYNLYDGIYVNGTSGSQANNINIVGNIIYSGLYASTGIHRYQINLDTYHINCTIAGNSVKFNGNGVIDKTRAFVHGVADTDTCDFNWNSSYVRVCQTANLPVTAGGWIKDTFNAVTTDIEGEWDGVNNQITVREKGIYNLNLNLLWNTATPNGYVLHKVVVNGSTETRLPGQKFGSSAGFEATGGTVALKLNAGDTVAVYSYISGADTVLGGTSYSYLIFNRIM